MEFGDLFPVLVGDILLSGKLVIGLRQLVLAEESPELLLVLLVVLVLLVDLILDLCLELATHLPYLRRNDVPQDLVHRGNSIKRRLGRLIELDEVLRVGHGNLCVVRHLLEEDSARFIFSHLVVILRGLELFLVVALIIRRNNIHDALAAKEHFVGSLASSSGDTHVCAFVLRDLVPADGKHLPGRGLKVFLVILHDLGELLLLERLCDLVQLRLLVGCPEV